MKIYSDVITSADVHRAFADARCAGADIHVDELRTWKPRRHAHGTEVWAESVSGTRATAHRPIGSYDLSDVPRAASWSDWGQVIARLYVLDPAARIGFYKDAADFEAKVRQYPRKGQSLAFLDILHERVTLRFPGYPAISGVGPTITAVDS
jgi:hypothetical protein